MYLKKETSKDVRKSKRIVNIHYSNRGWKVIF